MIWRTVFLRISCILFPLLLLLLWYAKSSYDAVREADAVVSDMMASSFRSNVIIELSVKDEAGNPLKANATVSMFLPIGSQGGEHHESISVDGSKRLEYRGVLSMDITIRADQRGYENDFRSWTFTDLDPDDFRFAPDGRTIIVRHESVLRSFPRSEKAKLDVVFANLDQGKDSEVRSVVSYIEGPQGASIRGEIPSTDSDQCTIPTLFSAFRSSTDDILPVMVEDRIFYPNGRRVVLEVCSPFADDGLLFAGVDVAGPGFGNAAREAPVDGYVKQLVLPYEMFEGKKNRVVYVRLGGLYGKMIVYGRRFVLLDPSTLTPVGGPTLSIRLAYNTTGSRNLRTTFPN